jgi:hypothetical protein
MRRTFRPLAEFQPGTAMHMTRYDDTSGTYQEEGYKIPSSFSGYAAKRFLGHR